MARDRAFGAPFKAILAPADLLYMAAFMQRYVQLWGCPGDPAERYAWAERHPARSTFAAALLWGPAMTPFAFFVSGGNAAVIIPCALGGTGLFFAGAYGAMRIRLLRRAFGRERRRP
jgi:hypothetical protein